MIQSNVQVLIHSERLRHNIRELQKIHPCLMPVIKADAYGHGVTDVAKILMEERIRHFAVGTVEEGALLREHGISCFLLSLLGIVTTQDISTALGQGIVPLVHGYAGLALIQAQKKISWPSGKRLSIAIKFDTGMSRLGFLPEQAATLARFLQTMPEVEPVLVVTHLAVADDPDQDSFTREQMQRFREGTAILKQTFPEIQTSVLNSPGLLVWPQEPCDLARPGFSLYGGNPLAGTFREPLGASVLPVMEVFAPIIATHTVEPGATISYGRLFQAERPMRVAVLGIGYADGYPRILSSRGFVCIHGKRAPILGRICMQMTIVDITDIPEVRDGDLAAVLGGEGSGAIRPEELAEWAQTIPYELFCILGTHNKQLRKLVL